ncbi:thioredoxin family protein [Patescibacteria group bacterium]|nr:thioredoxin family protein [Patescibacteria group bacterium]
MKVLKIGALWCSGCLVMVPRWKEIEKENPWLETTYYDYDSSPQVVSEYGLEEGLLPTFIFLDKDGVEVHRLSGEVDKNTLLELVNKYRES